jgi:hypothetical protein
MLNKMRDGLAEKKNNLQIKTYNAITTHSMIIIDPSSGRGSMKVEPYPFRTPQQYRRVFIISQQHQQNLFDVYWNAFNSLWDYTDEIRPTVS